jgi:hypothetical protein
MPDEPDELINTVTHTEDAFAGQLGQLDHEEGLDPNAHDSDVIQLRKACRLQKYSESASGSFGRPSVFRDDERASLSRTT